MTSRLEPAHAPGPNSLAERTGSGWYENALVASLSISAGLVFLDRLGIVFVFPQIQRAFHLDQAQLGLLIGITSLTWALSSILVSFLSDALGGRAKLIITLCVLGFSCATGLMAVTASFAAILAVRAILGVFSGPSIPLMQSMVAKASSPWRLGANMGLVVAGMMLMGNALPPLLITSLAGAFGWRRAFLCLCVAGFLMAVVLWMILKPDAEAAGAAAHAPRVGMREAVGLLRNRNVILSFIAALALIGFLVTFASFSPLFLVHDRTMSGRLRTIVLTLIGIAGALGCLLAPTLSDRLPRKACAIVATGCTMLLPVALIVMRTHHAAMPLVLGVQLVAGGAMTLAVFIIPGESVPRRLAATTFGLSQSLGELLGGATMPGIAGLLSDKYGLTSAMWFCCGLGALSLVAVLGMREPPRRGRVAADDMLLPTAGDGAAGVIDQTGSVQSRMISRR